MSARFAKVVLGLMAAFLPIVAATSWAGPWVLGPREFYSEVRGSYFSTTTFLDENGERPTLPGGGTYESRAGVWASEVGWKSRLSLRIDIPFESVTMQSPTPGYQETETGLSDLVLGIKGRLVSGGTVVAAELDWKAPLGYDADLTPSLGDGRQDGIGILHVGTEIPKLQGFLEASGGYRMRLESYGDANDDFFATANAGFWIGQSLLISGHYRSRYEQSGSLVVDDANGESGELHATVHEVGPEIRYRVDDFLDVFAGSHHTASGENTLHRNVIYVGLATRKTQLNRLQGFLGNKKRQ